MHKLETIQMPTISVKDRVSNIKEQLNKVNTKRKLQVASSCGLNLKKDNVLESSSLAWSQWEQFDQFNQIV